MHLLSGSQHFLLSKQAKTLTLAQVFRMSDAEAEVMFKRIRWAATNGDPVCSHCGSLDAYDCRRPNGAPRFRCRECGKDFSITSGTLFASHKLPLRGYLAAVAIFCNEVKGKSMLAMSRDLGLSYKSAFVLAHKLREAMSEEMNGRRIGDDRAEAEVDGAAFGGYVKPANLREDRVDRFSSTLRKRATRCSRSSSMPFLANLRTGGEAGPDGVQRNETLYRQQVEPGDVFGHVFRRRSASHWPHSDQDGRHLIAVESTRGAVDSMARTPYCLMRSSLMRGGHPALQRDAGNLRVDSQTTPTSFLVE
jgi:transposase-like protein